MQLPGDDHVWYAGDVESLFDQVEAFLTGVRAEASGARVLTTVLFTDIVGSTERAAQLGDRAWTELLETHDELVRGQVGGFRGKLIKTSGDGTLAIFDGPARAIHGLAVHIGARIAGFAGADEILVSASVPPLVAGSGIGFGERGRHTLKGVPGELGGVRG